MMKIAASSTDKFSNSTEPVIAQQQLDLFNRFYPNKFQAMCMLFMKKCPLKYLLSSLVCARKAPTMLKYPYLLRFVADTSKLIPTFANCYAQLAEVLQNLSRTATVCLKQSMSGQSLGEERIVTYFRALEVGFFLCPCTFQNELSIPLRICSPNTEFLFHQRVKKQLKLPSLPFAVVVRTLQQPSLCKDHPSCTYKAQVHHDRNVNRRCISKKSLPL